MENEIVTWLVQPELIWEDVEANIEILDRMLEGVAGQVDLIILPETFSTGFTMNSDRFADDMDGKAVTWMKEKAGRLGAVITGSVITREEGRIYNRLHWITPDGGHEHYDKRHLFRMGRENEHFSEGTLRKLFSLGAFRFCPQICYDLRFPVFSRNRNDYDILFYVANWPAPRHEVWETLLKARAIENQSYVVGVNRTGTDGLGVAHKGGSCVFDSYGREILQMDHGPGIARVILSLDMVRDFRKKFPAWKDADDFRLL